MHDVQHNDSAPCSADGAQTVAALLRRTARSVNAPLGFFEDEQEQKEEQQDE